MKDARARGDAAKETIAAGVDPGAKAKIEKRTRQIASGNTFGLISAEYVTRLIDEGRADATIEKVRWPLGLAMPAPDKRPISEISAAEVLAVLCAIEKRGTHETARRLRSTIGTVFRFAIATARAENDPTFALKGALITPKVKHRAGVTNPKGIGALLRAMDDFEGQATTHAALMLMASPSGTGLRLLARGKAHITVKVDAAHVEIYRSQRYLTISGRHLETTPSEIQPAPRTYARLLERVGEFDARKAAKLAAPVDHKPARTIETTPIASPGSGGFFRNVNDAAFGNLDAWVPTMFPRTRRQASTQGYRISSRQLGRNLQEDLSITPMGAEDFGLEEPRTAIDLVVEYTFASSVVDAALWLCERLNVPPESLGYRGGHKEPEALGATVVEHMSGNERGGQDHSPLPLRPDIEKSEPFPIAALGSILAPAAKAIAEKVQVSAAVAGQSVLAAASLAAQAHADVLMPYGQKRPLSLFMATVAASGDRKSATDNEATRPVVQREAQLGAEHKTARAEWSVKSAAWAAEKRKIENNAKIGLEERQERLMGMPRN